MAKVRLNMEVSEDLVRLLDSLAGQEDVTRTEIVRRALSVMKAYDSQMKAGRIHMGFAANPECLDAEMLGILTPPVADLDVRRTRSAPGQREEPVAVDG